MIGLVGLIYIDGDHRASAVYLDAIKSFDLCSSGGIIVFDDYLWGEGAEAPRIGIDKFLDEFDGQYEIISKDIQLAIKKVKRGIDEK